MVKCLQPVDFDKKRAAFVWQGRGWETKGFLKWPATCLMGTKILKSTVFLYLGRVL